MTKHIRGTRETENKLPKSQEEERYPPERK
jgi:hypothetical protein